MKKFLILVPLFLSACFSASDKTESCPEISIQRDMARAYQNDGKYDEFQIVLAGYEGYCYLEPADNRRYAVITPLFKVRRLKDSLTTSLDVDFYVKTSVNAENYLGIRRYSQTLNIARGEKEKMLQGRRTVTRISRPPYDGFDIKLGLSVSEAERERLKKLYDIDYSYVSEDEMQAVQDIETVYLEIGKDEEVIYSEAAGKPKVVKKNRQKSTCQN